MSEYLILIYGDEAAMEAGGQQLWDELMAGHNAFTPPPRARIMRRTATS